MRILVLIPHVCRLERTDAAAEYGSHRGPLPRAQALSSLVASLHRFHGLHTSQNPSFLEHGTPGDHGDELDIVVITQRGMNVLDLAGLLESRLDIHYVEGDPMMVPFEAQRVMRERLGEYDLYATIEDDHTIHDPEFFAKVRWFARSFGDDRALIPHRYELPHGGRIERVYFEPEYGHVPRADDLVGDWHGMRHRFRRAGIPHTGSAIVTDDQLRRWVRHPRFYDRRVDWIGPLESGMTRAFSLAFTCFRCFDDPAFLSLEHQGSRFAQEHFPDRDYRDAPLELVARAVDGTGASPTDLVLNGLQQAHMQAEIRRLRMEIVNRDRTLSSRAQLLGRVARLTRQALLRRRWMGAGGPKP